MTEMRTIAVHRLPIKLDAFLKLAALVATGGEAKQIVGDGLVQVNGQVERRRGRKLVDGDVVVVDGASAVKVELTSS